MPIIASIFKKKYLQTKSSDDQVDTDNNSPKQGDRESGIIFVECYDIFCDAWKSYDDDSLHEWYPTDEGDDASPIEWPYIVHEDARDTERQWRISCDEYDTWFTYYWLHVSEYDLSSEEKEYSEDEKRKSPKLCQKYCSVHRKIIRK